MATKLSKTTKEVKQLLLYFLGFVALVFIITWISSQVKTPITVPDNSNASAYPKADEAFGPIPAPKLQSLVINTGSKAIIAKNSSPFPTLPPVAYIYTIKPEREYLGDADAARIAAKKLNFPNEETKAINNIMYWETPEKNRVFSYDNAQRLSNFHYNTYPINSNFSLLPNSSDYANLAILLASQLGIRTESFASTYSRVDLVQVKQDGQMSTITTKPNAAHVNLYRKALLSKPISQSSPETFTEVRRYQATGGIIEALIAGDGKDIATNLWQLHYKQYSYGSDVGLYNLLTPLEAFTKLQTRQSGYIYQLSLDNSNFFNPSTALNINEFTLEVEKTKVIYLEPENRLNEQAWTNYLQPYYYFSGTFVTADQQKGACAFIVPALTDTSYLSTSNP